MDVSRVFGVVALAMTLGLTGILGLLLSGLSLAPISEWQAVIVADTAVGLGAIAGCWMQAKRASRFNQNGDVVPVS